MNSDTTNPSDIENIHPFVLLQDPTVLTAVLKKRFPFSANIWNMLQSKSKSLEIHFYTLYPEINDNTWIVATFYREDYGLDVNVSAPPDGPITEEIKEAFATSNLIDWKKAYCFFAVETRISDMIYDISCKTKRIATDFRPCVLFHLGIEESLKLKADFGSDSNRENMEIKPLDRDQGVPFMVKTWKFAKEGSEIAIKNLIENNPTMGVYLDGKLVCGITLQGSGVLALLYTLKEHRQKGFAKICVSTIMKELAKQGLVPCLCVENSNHTSMAFQKKLGLVEGGDVDFIMHTASGF